MYHCYTQNTFIYNEEDPVNTCLRLLSIVFTREKMQSNSDSYLILVSVIALLLKENLNAIAPRIMFYFNVGNLLNPLLQSDDIQAQQLSLEIVG